jgi:hypothetical protein
MRVLRMNSSGDDVKVWQTFLQGQGLYAGALDGRFGNRTLDATRAFQQARGLEVDGFVGNHTLGAAMQLGLELAREDPPLPDGPVDGVSSLGDAWMPPPPPPATGTTVARDPRVISNHQVGELPCPPNPPPPVGWAYWRGSAPVSAVDLAVTIQENSKDFPMGSFVQSRIDGQLVAARVEWHDFQGATGLHGCFRGTNLLRPKPLS